MKHVLSLIIIMTLFLMITGCKSEDPVPTTSSQAFLIKPGDLVVINSTSDSLLLLDSNGNFKTILYDVDNIGESLYGIAFKSDTKEIIFTVNGATRVGAVSVVDGTYRNFISDANLTATARGLTQLSGGDILVVEASNIERFSTNGVRKTLVNAVVWPNTLGAMNAIEQISATADGGFVACASGSDNIKRFTENAVQVGATVSTGGADAFGCVEMANGNIAITYNIGTTDSIRTADSLLGTVTSIFADQAYLGAPRTLTIALNGNILAVDSGFNQIVEITPTGTYVRTLGGGILGTPTAIFSVPNY
jgi:hypothetical protein